MHHSAWKITKNPFILGGLMIDRCPPYLFMAFVTFFLSIFFALIPFSSGLLSLSSFAVTAEFFMGLIDTGL